MKAPPTKTFQPIYALSLNSSQQVLMFPDGLAGWQYDEANGWSRPAGGEFEHFEVGNCHKHGMFQQRVVCNLVSVRPFRALCPLCKVQRAAAEAEREKDYRQQLTAAEAARRCGLIASWLKDSGIPARFRDASFDGYVATTDPQRKVYDCCRRFAERFDLCEEKGTSLVLTGSPGTGKTHLGCAIVRHVISAYGKRAIFVAASTMLRAIKATYGNAAGDSDEVMKRFANCPLLVLDEVGVQVGSDHEKQLMFDIFNARYNELRPTVLISNLTASELEDYLGHRVMDRYRECGTVLAFQWASFRSRHATQPAP